MAPRKIGNVHPSWRNTKIESFPEKTLCWGCVSNLSLMWTKKAGHYDSKGFQGLFWWFSSWTMSTRLIMSYQLEKKIKPCISSVLSLRTIVMCLSSSKNSTTKWQWLNLLTSFRSVTQHTSSFANNTNARMPPTKNVQLLIAKTPWAMNMIISLSVPNKKTFVAHAKAMNVMCCGNLMPSTIGTTQTTANLWVLPPTALEIEPLETEKVLAMAAIIVAPPRSCSCYCNDHRDCNHKAVAYDYNGPNYHANNQSWSSSPSLGSWPLHS